MLPVPEASDSSEGVVNPLQAVLDLTNDVGFTFELLPLSDEERALLMIWPGRTEPRMVVFARAHTWRGDVAVALGAKYL